MNKTVGQHNAADISAAMGATGSGKTLHVKQQLRRQKPIRLMVWDYKREYGDFMKPITSLVEARRMARAERFKIVFQPSHDPKFDKEQFDFFCQLAFESKRLTFVAEELAFVTTANSAPQWWRSIILLGRAEAITVYGTSQRPASIDKNIFSNCNRIRTGRLNFKADIDTMAEVLTVDKDQVRLLLPLQYIERDIDTNQVTSGTIRWKK